jgi:hypothetical protein
MNKNIKITKSRQDDIHLKKDEYYWYQKNNIDVPEYVKIAQIHKDDNDYYYTIIMRNKSEKQTIGKYLFDFKNPPKYSILPGENRDRIQRIYDYGIIQGQLLVHNKTENREWRFEDIIPKNEEDRKRLNCVFNYAYNKGMCHQENKINNLNFDFYKNQLHEISNNKNI